MTAGKSIDKTFLTINSKLKEISQICILVEETIYENSLDDSEKEEERKKEREDIIKAIDNVREHCRSLEIGFDEIRLKDTSLLSLRTALTPLNNHPTGTRLTFNLSGGTKMLSLATFVMALWLDAEIYLTPRSGKLEQINIPRMHLNDIQKNPNYIQALKILSSHTERMVPQMKNNSLDADSEEMVQSWMAGRDFSREMTKKFQPVRFSGDSKETKEPNKGAISKIKGQLEKWNLLEERVNPKSKREKEYRLTADGEWALMMLTCEESSHSKTVNN